MTQSPWMAEGTSLSLVTLLILLGQECLTDLAHIMQSQSRWELSGRSCLPLALLNAIHGLPMVLWMILLLSMADSWWLLPSPSAVPHDTDIY